MPPVMELTNSASFETVIEATQALLNQVENGDCSPTDLRDQVVHLLQLEKGPRGFFATFLTDGRSLADHPPDALLEAFRSVPQTSAELLVKNLAMSTAMVVHHQRNQALDMMAGSQQVQQRCLQLIQTLQLETVAQELLALERSLDAEDRYSAFLNRWQYDAEQRQAIAAIVATCIPVGDR